MRVFMAPIRWLSRFSIFHSLRFRLTILVLVGALPALGLLLLTASQQREDALATGQEDANRLARLAAEDQTGVFEQAEQLLTTIARLPEVRGNNAEQCSQLMAELLEINSEFDNLGVVNDGGSAFCSGIEGDVGDTQIDRDFVDEVFAANNLVIGTYQIGPFSNEPTVTYAAPVPVDQGEPSRLVFASLDLSALDTFANLANLPEGAEFSVYDRNGVLLLRYPEEVEAIGKSFANDPVVERMISDPTGMSLRQYDETDSIYSGEWIEVRSDEGETPGAAFVIVSLPKEATVARANESFQDNLTRLGLAALVAVALAWVGADLFMSRDSESRKQLVANVYRVYETGDLQELDDAIALNMVDRNPAPGQVQGLSGYKQVVAQFRAAFPNGSLEPDELLADGDKVVAHVTLRGTQVAEFFGSPPSGEEVMAKGVETFRFANGVIVETWSMFTPLSIVERPGVQQPGPDAVHRPERRGMLQRLAGFFSRQGSA